MYKIKLYTHKLTVDISDDLLKVQEFLYRKIKQTAKKDIQFTFDIEETSIDYSNHSKLMKSSAYDVVMYIFNRVGTTPFSHAFVIDKNTCGVTISTSTWDDAVGGTWMTIAHELMHTFFKRLEAKGIIISDPMDVMYVKGVAYPYYKNWEPEAKDGNFAYAFQLLAQYWDKIAHSVATSPVNESSLPIVIIIRKSTKKQTTGILTASNAGASFACKTVERPWLNNANSISCIPTGTYQVKWTFSPKFMKYTYQVMNVPNRSGIRIHSANFYSQLQGCIALGDALVDVNKDGELDTINSKKTIALFENFMQKKPFTLILK